MARTARKSLKSIDWKSFGCTLVAGLDEAGRGCLAGPVFAAAVILKPDCKLKGLTDSKLIIPEKRKQLALQIKSFSLAWAVGIGSVEEIEAINILQASLLAMRRAVEALSILPELLLIDGDVKAGGHWRQETFVQGDLRLKPISAASIIAKTERDLFMERLHDLYPLYGFSSHKGYGTLEHRKAITEFGPSPVHRSTFAGVKEFISDISAFRKTRSL